MSEHLDQGSYTGSLSEEIVTQASEYASSGYVISRPEYSDWQCELFGGHQIMWRPDKGKEPNWFWRKMQFLVFGNRWVWRPLKS